MGDPSIYHKFKVWLLSTTAQLMPRDLVYFALLRVRYEVTDSRFWPIDSEEPHNKKSGNENVPSIDAAIGRWYAGSNWRFRPFTVRHGEKVYRDKVERQQPKQ